MADETSDATVDPEGVDELVEEARDLISLSGLHHGQTLRAGVELGLFDVIDKAATQASEIADQLDLDADHTYRLLRALASLGVVTEQSSRSFSITPLGEVFRTEHPESLAAPALFYQSPEVVAAFTQLPAIVREGGIDGFDSEFGRPFYEYIQQNPEFAEIYNDTMDRVMANETDAVLEALDSYDFSGITHVCDIGGGYGHLLCHLLAANPHLEGTVFDLPEVVGQENRQHGPELGVQDRCTYAGGDMFESVPAADAYVMKHVLDNWTDDECVEILSTIHDAAPPEARVFVVEYLVSESEPAEELAFVDIHQLVVLGGGVSTKQHLAAQMNQAGWELVEIRSPEEGPLRIAEAKKAE